MKTRNLYHFTLPIIIFSLNTFSYAEELSPEALMLQDALIKYRETREIRTTFSTSNGVKSENIVIHDEQGLLAARIFDTYREDKQRSAALAFRTITNFDSLTLVSFENKKVATIPNNNKGEIELLDKEFFSKEFSYVSMSPHAKSGLLQFVVAFTDKGKALFEKTNADFESLLYGVIASNSSDLKMPEVDAIFYYVDYDTLKIHKIEPIIIGMLPTVVGISKQIEYRDITENFAFYPNNFETKTFDDYNSAKQYVNSENIQ